MGTSERRMRRSALMFMIMATMLASLPLAGSAQGNSEAARECHRGEYQNWVRADGTTFSNPGECARYAAQGGTLTAPLPEAALACLDGGFATLAQFENTSAAFTTETACVEYAEQGGTLVPLQTGAGPYVVGTFKAESCTAVFTFSNLDGTHYWLVVRLGDGTIADTSNADHYGSTFRLDMSSPIDPGQSIVAEVYTSAEHVNPVAVSNVLVC